MTKKTLHFRVPINDKQWLSVTIWATRNSFLEGTRVYWGRKNKAFAAAYAISGRRKKRSGEWGRLLFSLENLGAGTVAHEIQHFMYDWTIHRYRKLSWAQDEPLAELCDKVTGLFWKNYYAKVK